MDEKIKELIAIGASVGAHCQPCLKFHVDKALEVGVDREEIAEAIAVGKMVQKGGLTAMRKFADELVSHISAAAPATRKVLKVYEPAMCCSSGVCGPSVDARLVAFAGALNAAAAHGGVVVERFNLAQQPQAFVDNQQAKAHLTELGQEKLPFIYLNDKLVFSGDYPDTKALFDFLGLDAASLSHASGQNQNADASVTLATVPGAAGNAGGCCSEEGCC